MFAGTTPDPTAWNYDPNRQIAGAFLNWDYGDFDSVRYTSTAGMALSRINWRPERQFAFFETSIMFKRGFSLYHDLEADQFNRDPVTGKTGGTGISRSFLTRPLSAHPLDRVRFESQLFPVAAHLRYAADCHGLLQKYLFQGFSAGVRLELPLGVGLYANLGKSRNDSDVRAIVERDVRRVLGELLGTGLRADARYTRFDSSFGKGNYQMISLSRAITDRLRIEAAGGTAEFSIQLHAKRPLAVRDLRRRLVFPAALLAGRRMDALSRRCTQL